MRPAPLPVCHDRDMDDDAQLPGAWVTASSDTPDACPICKTDVQPIPGVNQGPVVSGPPNPEPWQEVARCPKCDALLVRIPGDPWTGERPH